MKNWSFEYYRFHLKQEEKQIYDVIYTSWLRGIKKIEIKNILPPSYKYNLIVEAIIKDHPEVFWVNYYQYTIRIFKNHIVLSFEFYFSANEISKLSTMANNWKGRIAKSVPKHFSTKDKIWTIYDYLSRQVSYGKQCDAYSQTIIGPMSENNHISVCEGIAKSFKFLCDEVQIPSIIVFGDVTPEKQTELHAWNIVDTNQGNSHIDVTSELNFAHTFGKAEREKFLFTDSEMKNHHYNWNRNNTPRCMG